MLLSVESDEGCAFWHGFHHNFLAFHHVGVKAVKWLSVSHHDVVCDVHDVVDGAESYGGESVLQPFGRLFHFAVFDGDGAVAGAGLRLLYHHVVVQVVVVNGKSAAVRTVEAGLVSVLAEVGIEVACHSPVRAGVRVVWSDVNFDEPVALKSEILGCGHSCWCVVGQHHDAVVAVADSDLVLCADHAVAFNPTQF